MRIKFLMIGLWCAVFGAQSQNHQSPFISTGYTTSSLVCSEGKVFVWGQNSIPSLSSYGLLGTGSSLPVISTPVQVPFPNGVTIKQVSPGTSAHFLAVDCQGNVWSWGYNVSGQIGNGTTTPSVVTSPVKVKAGAGPADGDGNLTNVVAAYGGHENSFAILNTGRLVAWGGNDSTDNFTNSSGMLGNNTRVDSYAPVYVLDGSKPSGNTFLPLENVIQVQASDAAAFALVKEANGKTTLYSWGHTNPQKSTLGRGLQGGTYNGTNYPNGVSAVARPVTFPNGNQLENIVSISAGDVFCLALDKEGYVWAWGNGNWGGCTGQGNLVSHMDPRKVVKGNATGAGTDGVYLLAKSIAAGQAFGAAVTIDGKPVSWGNNTTSGVPPAGGILGDGTSNNALSPVYIVNSLSNAPDDDVVSISRGDLGGFYTRADNSIYTWGGNTFGQLGIGNTTDQRKALRFTYPVSCSTPDPAPYAFITPQDTLLCEARLNSGVGLLLNSRFNYTANAANYEVKWRKDGGIIASSTLQSLQLRNAIYAGQYSVEIEYKGTNSGCTTYPIAIDTSSIRAYSSSFNVPSNGVYCKFPVSIKANPLQAALNPLYTWYKNGSTTDSIGTTRGNSALLLNASDLDVDVNGDFFVFVEETRSAYGTVGLLNNTGLCNGNANNLPINALPNDLLLTVYEDVTIDSIDVYQKEFGNSSNPVKWQVSLFRTQIQNGQLTKGTKIQDAPYSLTTTNNTSVSTLRRVPVGLHLKGSKVGQTYLITFTSGGSVLNYEQCTITGYPFVDNLPKHALQWSSYTKAGNPASSLTQYGHYMFNMQFSLGQQYCDRKKVEFAKECITTDVETTDLDNTGILLVAPNPFKESLTVKVKNARKLSVLNSSGQIMEEHSFGDTHGDVSIGQQWPAGLYILQVQTSGSSTSYKVVKQ